MSLGATSAPHSPTLAHGTSHWHCVQPSSPACPFVSSLFCVNQLAFVGSQTCCVHTHTQISLHRAWGVRRTFRSCAAPSRAQTHTYTGTQRMLKSLCSLCQEGFGVQGQWEVMRVPLKVMRRVPMSPWGGVHLILWGLLVPLSITLSFLSCCSSSRCGLEFCFSLCFWSTRQRSLMARVPQVAHRIAHILQHRFGRWAYNE